ncbi:MAG: DNA polymerase III subunit gamma/tau [Phycisphaeraceae bacterium]|nr:DNA polymerase III subunit gamma/tau [Phycisphaeraceae bacterium]
MAYTVLARRYRSADFDEVVGQEAIAKTLQNAIKLNRVAHAYLFCGTRGVGKTSMARIFAKALNGGKEEIDAAIMSGKDTDVIEIDAASNNSVDNARELIANAAYRPLRGKKKIYIIDEVHMLSTAAFNALLKTMEEPPEHVMFILATTDPQKVPATIQSRCQRFDFRNIPATDISGHLAAVLKQEGVSAEPELVFQIARLGNGSMRDALSLLDRLIASGEKKLTVKTLEELLGLPARELVGALLDAFVSGTPGAALEAGDALLKRGIAIDQVFESLLERFRDLLVLATCGGSTELVELSDDARKSETARSAKYDPAALVHMIAMVENLQRSAKNSACPRALFDACLVRLALTDRLADATSVLREMKSEPRGAATVSTPAKKR